jgi:hypothetical protein
VYSALFVGRWCFKEADLAAFRKDVLSIRCLCHQLSVIFLHCSDISNLKYYVVCWDLLALAFCLDN